MPFLMGQWLLDLAEMVFGGTVLKEKGEATEAEPKSIDKWN